MTVFVPVLKYDGSPKLWNGEPLYCKAMPYNQGKRPPNYPVPAIRIEIFYDYDGVYIFDAVD